MQNPSRESAFALRIAERQRHARIPGLSVAVAAFDHILYSGAVGSADEKKPGAIDSSTHYRIGSVTKTFTAALIVTLARQGILALDARVGEHIEGTQLGRVTIAQLLSHSGGVQREPLTPMWQTFEGPTEEELAASLPASELVAEPGERWHYSNLGYAILGQIVKQATSETVEQLVQKQFLDPLGLSRTGWQASEPAAVGYRVDPYQDVLHVEPDMQQRAAGMGGQMWSTTTDLVEWAQALMGRRPQVLAPEVVESMHTLRVMTDTEHWTQGWGLGLILTQEDGRLYAGHTGAVPGFSAALVTDRATGLVVVVLANTMNAGVLGELAFELVELALPMVSASEPIEPWVPGEPCPSELSDVLGSWWFEAGETVFSWRAGKLEADPTSGSGGTSRFAREADDRYRVVSGRELGEVLDVQRDDEGNVTGLVWATYPYSRQPH